jgi:hypothetical protein
VHRHHGVEKESKINAFGFNSECELLAIAIKGPWTLFHGNAYDFFVRPAQQSLFEYAIGGFIDNLNSAFANGYHRTQRDNQTGLNSNQ